MQSRKSEEPYASFSLTAHPNDQSCKEAATKAGAASTAGITSSACCVIPIQPSKRTFLSLLTVTQVVQPERYPTVIQRSRMPATPFQLFLRLLPLFLLKARHRLVILSFKERSRIGTVIPTRVRRACSLRGSFRRQGTVSHPKMRTKGKWHVRNGRL